MDAKSFGWSRLGMSHAHSATWVLGLVVGCSPEPSAGDLHRNDVDTVSVAPPGDQDGVRAGSGGRSGGASEAFSPVAPGVPQAETRPDAGARADEEAVGRPALDLDVRRSLVVTEQPILDRFPFQRVMDQLAAQADVPGLTGLSLFQQWWDTQNRGPGLTGGPHCDSEIDPVYGASVNGFQYDCRDTPSEGAQAACTSFDEPACAYIPIGLFNRFDLASVDGAHCGEYRIVYAKASGQTDNRDRNLIIFEAALLNPVPVQGLQGCRKIVEAWAELSAIDDIEERADLLESFYFDGHGSVPAVVRVEHFGDNALGVGQIRTNQFMQPLGGATSIWTLREFKLDQSCGAAGRCLIASPVTDKGNPHGLLFGLGSSDPRAAQYQEYFVRENVGSLSASGLSDIAMSTPEGFNTAQSHASGSNEMRYALYFAESGTAFRANIDSKLRELQSSLTADDIVARATTQTCAGCHRLSNNADLGGGLVWPPSLGFVHITEQAPEVVDGVTRFRISQALTEAFLPVRKQVMEAYLLNRPGRLRGKGQSLGGRLTH